MIFSKLNLNDILFIKKARVYAAISTKDRNDAKNYFIILDEVIKSENEKQIKALVKFFNKNFKVDYYDEACVCYSKVSKHMSNKLQEYVDYINENKTDSEEQVA